MGEVRQVAATIKHEKLLGELSEIFEKLRVAGDLINANQGSICLTARNGWPADPTAEGDSWKE